MKVNKLFFSLFFFVLVISVSHAQLYTYIEKTGDEKHYQQISKKHVGKQLVLTLTCDDKFSRHLYEPVGYTRQWIMKDKTAGYDFEARRVNNMIHIKGIYQSKEIDKSVEIDHLPWLNKLDHGLSAWVRSDEKSTTFWTLKLGSDLEPIRFEAEKTGEERITTSAGVFDAIKIKINLHGFLLSSLWSANSWYRKEDGLFLKYEGTDGPGTPLTINELHQLFRH